MINESEHFNFDLESKAKLLGSLLLFIKVFYKLKTGREFKITEPIGRESHQITICKALTRAFKLQIVNQRLLINIQPGSGKSTILTYFVAWALAHFPDSNFIYVSYSSELATKHTYSIKEIISLPEYKRLFGVEIKSDSKAKDNFQTTSGGSVRAFGSTGSITGQDAGLPGLDRFSGCLIFDDMHKPDEVFSDTMRNKVTDNYFSTLIHRRRGVNVPFIGIGQCLHEDDLFMRLRNGYDGYEWESVILKAIDECGNVLTPDNTPQEFLMILKEKSPYVYASQYDQNPVPAGGGIFKPDWFVLTDEDPEIFATFITADTSETDKNYNDATVFSFWGIHRIKHHEVETNEYGLHWIDTLETWIEPKDLEDEFLQFYAGCMRYKVKPSLIAIEKKSTGVTLLSVLKTLQGLRVLDIERNKGKGARFMAIQPIVASRLISLPRYGKHTHKCIEHCTKLTANDSHRWDDIGDTFCDAVNIGIIERILITKTQPTPHVDDFAKMLGGHNKRISTIRKDMYSRM